jgi:hypothetical protein
MLGDLVDTVVRYYFSNRKAIEEGKEPETSEYNAQIGLLNKIELRLFDIDKRTSSLEIIGN